MEKARVVNLHKEEYDIYIGRGSEWGNDWSHLTSSKALYIVPTREEAIDCYRGYIEFLILADTKFIEKLSKLNGKTLGCYCKPKSCHGDILVEFAWKYRKIKPKGE